MTSELLGIGFSMLRSLRSTAYACGIATSLDELGKTSVAELLWGDSGCCGLPDICSVRLWVSIS